MSSLLLRTILGVACSQLVAVRSDNVEPSDGDLPYKVSNRLSCLSTYLEKKNCPPKNQKLCSLTLGLLAVRKAIHTEGLRACGDVHLMDQSGYGYMRR